MQTDYNARAASAVAPANCVGLVSRLYGKSGELVIKLLDNFPTQVERLWIVSDEIATPLFLTSFVEQGAAKAVVVFEDFETEGLACQLIGHKLYAEHAENDQEEEGEWDFVLGYSFTDLTSKRKGRVSDVYPSEMNPLIGVELEGQSDEVLVPIALPLIEKIERRSRRITMRLVDGFFDGDL
ncbi:MAG: hypothetical protein RSE22_04820 [Mucinivorans sp.]